MSTNETNKRSLARLMVSLKPRWRPATTARRISTHEIEGLEQLQLINSKLSLWASAQDHSMPDNEDKISPNEELPLDQSPPSTVLQLQLGPNGEVVVPPARVQRRSAAPATPAIQPEEIEELMDGVWGSVSEGLVEGENSLSGGSGSTEGRQSRGRMGRVVRKVLGFVY